MKYLIVSAIGLLLLVLLQIDDELSSTSQKWVAKLENDRVADSKAYHYLSGIMASKGEDVMSTGKARCSAYKKIEESARPFDNEIVFDDYAENKKLLKPDPDNKIYCKLWQRDCINKVLKNSSKWKSELEAHSELLERYRTFLTLTDFITLTKPSLFELNLEYDYLRYGNRLVILESLIQAESGFPEKAMDSLVEDIKKFRRQLVVADNLIHKMFFVNMIADNLNIMAYISNRYNYHRDTEISYLTPAELSVKNPVIREFGMIYYLYINLNENPEIFEVDGNMPAWLVRIIFKPNKTINQAARVFEKIIYMSTVTPQEFAAFQLSEDEVLDEDIDLFNFAGSVLNNIASPDYYIYIARLYDLNCKISLVNYLLADKSSLPVNPYYPSSNALETGDGEICFNGPYKDETGLRCIRNRI
ncbi:hypothetical protein MNBD_GAMMA09-2959 [hydrothermal vent metagenome]|uniref:Uncharacterized protein n=1 Tax=hydrothermal vent metagenome TaxID=652676 RepID=A0A3B0XAQ8_9ZZZZ